MRICFIQYTSPAAYPPIMNASNILLERGHEIYLWGVGSQGDAGKLEMNVRKGMSLWKMPYCRPGLRQKLHYLQFFVLCFVGVLLKRPAIVYVSDLWSYPIGLLISYLPFVRVVAHEHDTPPESGNAITRIFLGCRRRLFKRATATVFPQNERAEIAKKKVSPALPLVVWNCPRVAECSNKEIPEKHSEFVLWYHGSIVESQFPLSVVSAIAKLPSSYTLRFAGYETIGSQGYVTRILDRAKELGVADRVKYIGTPPTRTELFDEAAKCDIGLALFDKKFREPMVGASNKPFDYLCCGLGVLTNNTSEWTEFFAACSAAVACDPEDPCSIADAITTFASDPSLVKSKKQHGRDMIMSQWNYERQFSAVVGELNL